MGASLALLRRTDKRWLYAVTYADEGQWSEEKQKHTGTIYRATNWQYLGAKRSHPRWIGPDGQLVATKATVNRTYEEMLALGYRRVEPSPIHKYVYNLAHPGQPVPHAHL